MAVLTEPSLVRVLPAVPLDMPPMAKGRSSKTRSVMFRRPKGGMSGIPFRRFRDPLPREIAALTRNQASESPQCSGDVIPRGNVPESGWQHFCLSSPSRKKNNVFPRVKKIGFSKWF